VDPESEDLLALAVAAARSPEGFAHEPGPRRNLVTGSPAVERVRRDLCPGVLRPWPAADGALVRIRLAGGRITGTRLAALARVSAEYGDGDVHLTGRANLQVRGLPSSSHGSLPAEVVDAIEATGLLPSRTHELARNLMVSPLTGIYGGRTDLRPVVRELDERLCAEPALSTLPGRFLFVLDDGRGDLAVRDTDLGAVVLDPRSAQVRVGAHGWGPVVPLADVARHLTGLALEFARVRGDGPDAPWHVDELTAPLAPASARDPRAAVSSPPLAYGTLDGAEHVPAPDGVLDARLVERLVSRSGEEDLVVTPWRGVLVRGAAR
jgi:precorrin-3B synthase